MRARVGITSTVPVEVILAAGASPVDLNNCFLQSDSPEALVEWAEGRGFPRACCAWIKGIFAAVIKEEAADRVVGVVHGDCSATSALMERLVAEGIPVTPFSYPVVRGRRDMARELSRFARHLRTTVAQAEIVRRRLKPVRACIGELDRMTWEDGTVTGGENHAWLVSSSDFRGDPGEFERAISAFVGDAASRRRRTSRVRLAYVGVPGILTDLYDFLHGVGAAVVFNETQRQFSMPFPCHDLVGQYLSYTYPYGLPARIEDIDRELRLRRVDGVVHYVQSFCFRNVHDYLLRRSVGVPVLTLEGDRPGPLDARSKLRLESFVEMLAERGVS